MKRCIAAAMMAIFLLAAAVPAWAREETRFASAAALAEYIEGECASLAEEIKFSYTEELDDFFSEPEPIEALLYSRGMIDWLQLPDPETREIRLKYIQYYPGYAIAQRYMAGETHLLSEEESAVLEAAQRIVSEALETARNDYELMLAFHDALVRSVTYENSEGYGPESRDTAVGALLNGRAECDGYADAFYLMCTLAGIPAGYQHGDAKSEDGWTGHLWNVVEQDGLWYHVDVTWDDIGWDSYPDMCTYRWFMIGSSEISGTHEWEESCITRTVAEENREDLFFYTRVPGEGDYAACVDTLEDAVKYIVSAKDGAAEQYVHVYVREQYESSSPLNDLLFGSSLKGGWSIYSYPMGEYTCFDILLAG